MTDQDIRIIKKYPNRRLYDTEESRYITLADVQKLVRDNESFKVVDTQSGDDITRNILIQVIIEQESGDKPMFTTEMLTKFIRFYDDVTHGVFSSYLEKNLELFAEQNKLMRNQMSDFMGANALKSMTDIAQRNFDLWQEVQNNFFEASGMTPPKRDDRKTGDE